MTQARSWAALMFAAFAVSATACGHNVGVRFNDGRTTDRVDHGSPDQGVRQDSSENAASGRRPVGRHR